MFATIIRIRCVPVAGVEFFLSVADVDTFPPTDRAGMGGAVFVFPFSLRQVAKGRQINCPDLRG